MKESDALPFVTIVIPCRNEEKFIGPCLNSVVANDYPKTRLEVLVMDGMSHDGTRAIIQDYAGRYEFVRLLDNPGKITSAALNRGIAASKGNIIIWMSAHNRYEKNYISRSVECLKESGADNVGGMMITMPRQDTLVAWAIVACLSHRFGVGNSYFRLRSGKPRWVDTVFGGCYRKDTLARVGLFNEKLVRGQDMEFNLRLKSIGGRTWLAPDIVTYYYARSDMKSFWNHNWINGVWAILPFLYSPVMPVSWRHLAPLAFVSGLLVSAALALVWPPGRWIFYGIVGLYLLANLAASAQIAVRKRDFRYFLIMPAVFASLHLGYGLGSLWGVAKSAFLAMTSQREHQSK